MKDSQRFSCIAVRTNTTKKRQVNDKQLDFKFEISNNMEYKIDGIWDSTIYARELAG